MKLVVDAETDKVLGCHMVGPDAGEIIQGLGVALKAGATKQQFDENHWRAPDRCRRVRDHAHRDTLIPPCQLLHGLAATGP